MPNAKSVLTDIQKGEKKIYIITTINMEQSPSKWIGSTIVDAVNFKPIYHSSFNSQRNKVLNFGKEVTGYYMNKKTETKNTYFRKNRKTIF